MHKMKLRGGEIIPVLNEQHFTNLASGLTSYQTVDFEVSVATIEKGGSESLSVVSAVIGGHEQESSSNSSDHVAKLGFKVPVKFPVKSPKVNNK